MKSILPVMLLILLMAEISFTSCGKQKSGFTVDVMLEKEWKEVNDTANLNITYTIENYPAGQQTIYDWSEALNLLNSPANYNSNRILLSQDHYKNEPIEEVSQASYHEKDSLGFKRFVRSIGSVNWIPSAAVKTILDTLQAAYRKELFFYGSKNFGGTFIHISDNGIDYYLHFTFHLGFSDKMDSLCQGKVSLQNGNTTSAFSNNIYAGNLAFIGILEGYRISKDPVEELLGYKISHKKYPEKNVYFLTDTFKANSSPLKFGDRYRPRKILMSAVN